MAEKVLLIWDHCDGDIKMYEFDAASKEAFIARDAHNIYVNGDENDEPANKLNLLLAGRKPLYASSGAYYAIDPAGNKPENTEDYPDTISVEAPELADPPVLVGNYAAIYVSGFLP